MHQIIASCLRIRVLLVAAAALLLLAGIYKIRETPLDVIPEFSPLSVVVKTEALGLSTSEVESLITVPMEADLLNGVPWLRSIESESITGLSSIEMFFPPGTNLLRARQMVQERLVQAHALPNVSAPPVMLQPISSASRIMHVGMSSKTVSLIDMSVLARWTIVPRLVGVPGVANVSVWGMRNRQLQVLVDPATLNAKGVTLEQIVKTAGESVWASPLTFLNSSTPGSGGFVDTPNQRLAVRHVSPTATPETFAKVPVYGTSVALGDVTKVVEDSHPLIGDALLKDGPGLMLVIQKLPDANTVEVTREVEAALAELAPGMKGIEVDTSIYRPASFIERATKNLHIAALAAAVLLAIALFVLLGNWRAALVAALAIAFSLVAVGFVLGWRGENINMMIVAGLLVAIAVIVDDAIQDTEHILRRLREMPAGDANASRLSVIGKAAVEVRGPMLYATVIIILLVMPILFMSGPAARFFEPLTWSYILAVVSSLVVALTITPALCVMLLAVAGPGESATTGVVAGLQRIYNQWTGSGVNSPKMIYVVAGVAALAGYLIWTQMEHSMVPAFKETDVVIEWSGAPGTSLQATKTTIASLIKDVRAIPGVRNAAAHIGRAVLSDDAADVNTAEVWVSIGPEANYKATLAALEAAVDAYPGVDGEVTTFLTKKMRESLTGGEDQITVRTYGHDLSILRGKAEEIRALLSQIEGIRDAKVDLPDDRTTIEVKVDLDKARKYGLKPGDVRRAASAMVSGIIVGALFEDQKVFEVVVWGDPSVRANLDAIRNMLIDAETPKGTQVRLFEVADVRTVSTPGVIRRQGVSRRIDIAAEVSGRDLATVSREVARRIKDVPFPFEYHAQVLGEHFARRDAVKSFGRYMAAAALIAFLVLQAALGSWRLATLSVLSVPVILFGCLIGALLDGAVFTLGTLLGFAAVLALTTRQGIQLVRHFQSLEQTEGVAFNQALVQRGVRERFTPIITTVVSLIAVSLPFVVLGNNAGLEIAHPMAVAMIGGSLASLLVTLCGIPALYQRYGAHSVAGRTLELSSQPA